MPDVNDKRRRTVDSVVLLLNNLVIKQLFHGYLGNSHPQSLSRGEDLGNCCLNLSQIFSTNSGQWFDCFPRNHEITVYYQQIVQSDYTCCIKALIRCSCLRHFIQYLIISKKVRRCIKA